jgi:Protein of unknown function (DUF2854)
MTSGSQLDRSAAVLMQIWRRATSRRGTGPRLKGLREEVIDGRYALTLEFENRNGMTEEQWKSKEDKFGSFFGPGVTSKVRTQPNRKGPCAVLCICHAGPSCDYEARLLTGTWSASASPEV